MSAGKYQPCWFLTPIGLFYMHMCVHVIAWFQVGNKSNCVAWCGTCVACMVHHMLPHHATGVIDVWRQHLCHGTKDRSLATMVWHHATGLIDVWRQHLSHSTKDRSLATVVACPNWR